MRDETRRIIRTAARRAGDLVVAHAVLAAVIIASDAVGWLRH
ncbi:hypothetical protein [Actinomadura flavalba]|nr:hypothetical protein [Actinomadura flavalba]